MECVTPSVYPRFNGPAPHSTQWPRFPVTPTRRSVFQAVIVLLESCCMPASVWDREIVLVSIRNSSTAPDRSSRLTATTGPFTHLTVIICAWTYCYRSCLLFSSQTTPTVAMELCIARQPCKSGQSVLVPPLPYYLWFIDLSVRYGWCDFSKSTSPIFMAHMFSILKVINIDFWGSRSKLKAQGQNRHTESFQILDRSVVVWDLSTSVHYVHLADITKTVKRNI